MSRVTLVEAYGENFLSYPEIHLPLDNQGLVFISGEMELNRARSNGAGKTTAISLPSWIAWGKMLRGMKNVSRVVRYDQEAGYGILRGFIGDQEFEIERKRSNLGKGETELLASFGGHSRAPDVQREINQHLNTFELAQNTVFLAQRKALEFLTAEDSQRRHILEELLKIGVWGLRRNRAKQDLEEFEKDLQRFEHERQVAQAKLTGLKIELRHKQELATVDLRAQREAKVSEMNSIMEKLAESDYFYKDAVAEEQRLAEEEASARQKYEAVQHSLNQQSKNILSLQVKLKNAKQVRDGLVSGTCPTCHQTVPPDPAGMSERDEIIKTISRQMVEADDRYKSEAETVPILKASWESVRAEWLKARDWRSSVESANTAATVRRTSLLSEIATIEEKIRQQKVNSSEDLVSDIYEQERLIATRTEIIHELEAGISTLRLLKDGFGIKGAPSILINESLPQLVLATNSILETVSDGEFAIDILPADVGRTKGAIIDRLTFYVYHKGRGIYLEDCSAGEQRRIVISLFLGLARTQEVITGQAWNVRFFDELFDELDVPGIEKVMTVLRSMVGVGTLLVTSHRSELATLDGFHQRWIVRKGPLGSRLLAA